MKAVFLAAAATAVAIGYLVSRPEAAILSAVMLASLLALVTLGSGVRMGHRIQGEQLPPRMQQAAVGAVLIGVVSYQVAFNYLPANLRLQAAGVIAGGALLVGVALIISSGVQGSAGVLSLIGALIGLSALGAVFGLHSMPGLGFFRFSFPLMVACGLVLRPQAIPVRLVAWLTPCLVLLATGISYSHGTQFLKNAYRLVPFTGGTLDGLHSSAYVLATCAVIINELRRQRVMPPWASWVSIAVAVTGVVGYRVATAVVMLVTYFTLRGLLSAKSVRSRLLIGGVAALVLTVGYQARVGQQSRSVSGPQTVTLDRFSSGRLGAWSDRLVLIDSEGTSRLLLGGGINADLISTSAWSGAVKDSHNDFLTILTSQGLLGLAVYIILLGLLTRLAGSESWPIMAFLLAGSAVSNALLVRPMIAPLFWLAVGISIRRRSVIPIRHSDQPEGVPERVAVRRSDRRERPAVALAYERRRA